MTQSINVSALPDIPMFLLLLALPAISPLLFLSFLPSQTVLVEKSWSCFDLDHPFRALCIDIYYSKWFDRVVLALILLNCGFLAIRDVESPETTLRNQLSLQSELAFTGLFTVEMLIKMTATGVLGKHGYMASGWNVLDLIIVVVGYVENDTQLFCFGGSVVSCVRFER